MKGRFPISERTVLFSLSLVHRTQKKHRRNTEHKIEIL
jgi:hypothetical protein